MKRIVLIIIFALLLIFSAAEIELSNLAFSIGAKVNPFVAVLFIFLFALFICTLGCCFISKKR